MAEKLSVKKRIVQISNLLRIDKDGKNTFSNYEYFKPEDILKGLNPLLEEKDLISIFNLKNDENKDGYYVAQLIIEDTESADKVIYEFDIEKAEVKGANKSQNSGATLRYAKRYSLMNAFNIAVNEDDFDSKKTKPVNKPSKPLTERTSDMLNVFSKELGVTKESIEKFLCKKSPNITDADISKMTTLYSEIKSGKKKKDEVFK